MAKDKTKKVNISEYLKRLSEIADWFEEQDEVDIEKGLEKVKEASLLIKKSRKRLEEIENEFEEVKKEVAKEIEEDGEDEDDEEEEDEKEVDVKDIPF